MNKSIVVSILVFLNLSLFAQKSDKDLPLVNKKIIQYVEDAIGSKVGSGQCWDLAAAALNYAEASWDGRYVYGKVISNKNKNLLSGDIILFKNVIAEYSEGNSTYTHSYEHHTAIIYKVINNHSFKIAHQNTGNGNKKVLISEFDSDWITEGELIFFRPQK